MDVVHCADARRIQNNSGTRVSGGKEAGLQSALVQETTFRGDSRNEDAGEMNAGRYTLTKAPCRCVRFRRGSALKDLTDESPGSPGNALSFPNPRPETIKAGDKKLRD